MRSLVGRMTDVDIDLEASNQGAWPSTSRVRLERIAKLGKKSTLVGPFY